VSRAAIEPSTTARLCSLLNVDVGDLVVEPLPGGLSNRSFRLTHGASSWAARLPFATEGQRVQTLDPASEEQLLIAVAQAGLTPEVVVYDPGTGALITRYLGSAVAWTAEKARLPENVGRIAVTLRSLHGVKATPKLGRFRPVELSERYLESARCARRGGNRGRDFDDEEQGWTRALKRLASVYEANFSPSALCHNDLVAANILDEGKIWLVDFEYAFLAHPILDLASLAGMNDYDAAQRSLLLEAYFDAESIPFRDEQLCEVVRLGRLLSYFWALSRWDDLPAPNEMSRFADSMAAMLR